MRTAAIERKTAETDIRLTLTLEGSGKSAVDTGCGFMDHMLTLFARHGRFDLDVKCAGDTNVDYHHTAQALGDKRGINRYGSCVLPMDEALILTAADLSGRACLVFDLPLASGRVGDFDTELVKEFFLGFVRSAACTLHIRELSGDNTHHVIEGTFKSFARTMRSAVAADPEAAGEIPSTKGLL